jgi:hypothetical protein
MPRASAAESGRARAQTMRWPRLAACACREVARLERS